MRVLDLFAGLEGWSEPFRERGHDVISLDFDPSFGTDIVADILEWDPAEMPWTPDLILASPPCEGFTVMNIGKNWTKPTDDPPNAPKTDLARLALAIVEQTRKVIADLGPLYFVIENPRAKLRKLPVVADLDRRTVSYCRYGEVYMKPTDLWGGFPPSFAERGVCDTRRTTTVDVDGETYVTDRTTGVACHVQAVRGARKGVQDKLSGPERAKVPYALSLDVCLAAERDIAADVADAGPVGRLF